MSNIRYFNLWRQMLHANTNGTFYEQEAILLLTSFAYSQNNLYSLTFFERRSVFEDWLLHKHSFRPIDRLIEPAENKRWFGKTVLTLFWPILTSIKRESVFTRADLNGSIQRQYRRLRSIYSDLYAQFHSETKYFSNKRTH